MNKVTIDRALIEQAVDAAFSPYCAQDLASLAPALRAVLAEPAVEPVVQFIASELDLLRQWFESMQDTNGGYIIDDDLALYKKIKAALKASLPPAEPAVEPVAEVTWDGVNPNVSFIRFLPTGAGLPVGTKLYTSPPPPAEPVRTSQDVRTVPLLSDEEILQLTPLWFKKYTDGVLLGHARAIEQLVRRKAGL